MKTKFQDNFHFRIKYLTVTGAVDKMYNTNPQPQQNQIHNCQTPQPRRKRKPAFSLTKTPAGTIEGEGAPATCNLQPVTCNL
jgi:hypothetical protein